jgi:hypothetical protein
MDDVKSFSYRGTAMSNTLGSNRFSKATRAAFTAFVLAEGIVLGLAYLLFQGYDRGLNSQTSDRMLSVFGGVAEVFVPLGMVVSIPVAVVTYVVVRLTDRPRRTDSSD